MSYGPLKRESGKQTYGLTFAKNKVPSAWVQNKMADGNTVTSLIVYPLTRLPYCLYHGAPLTR